MFKSRSENSVSLMTAAGFTHVVDMLFCFFVPKQEINHKTGQGADQHF
jgi:hypothetical protein